MFDHKLFLSFDDADEFLSEFLNNKYQDEDDYDEARGEYYIEEIENDNRSRA